MSYYSLYLFGNLNAIIELLVPAFIFLRKQERRSRFLLRLLVLILVFVGMYFFPSISLGPFLLTFVVSFLLAFVLLLFFFKISVYNALFVMTGAFALQHLCWNVVFILYESFAAITNPAGFLIYLAVFVVLYGLYAVLIPPNLLKDAGSGGSPTQLLISALILVVTYCLSTIVANYDLWNVYLRIYAIICCIFAILLQFGLLDRRRLENQKQRAEEDKLVIQELWNREKRQYEFSRDSIEMINIKCHDLKNQLNLLKTMGEEERKEHIRRLEEEVMVYGSIPRTDNDALDVVLTEKVLFCEKNRIRFTYIADGARISFMDPVDIAALFGNALDNAIETVMGEDGEDKRIIRLHITARQSFVSIHMENYCSKVRLFKDGLPVSTKKGGEEHGYGTKSMRHIAESYGGTLYLRQEGFIFITEVILPAAPEECSVPAECEKIQISDNP